MGIGISGSLNIENASAQCAGVFETVRPSRAQCPFCVTRAAFKISEKLPRSVLRVPTHHTHRPPSVRTFVRPPATD